MWALASNTYVTLILEHWNRKLYSSTSVGSSIYVQQLIRWTKKLKSEVINNKLIGRRKTVESPFSRVSLHVPRAGEILSRAWPILHHPAGASTSRRRRRVSFFLKRKFFYWIFGEKRYIAYANKCFCIVCLFICIMDCLPGQPIWNLLRYALVIADVDRLRNYI